MKIEKMYGMGIPSDMMHALRFLFMTPEEKGQMSLDECTAVYNNLPKDDPGRLEVLMIILDDSGYTVLALEEILKFVTSEDHASLLVAQMKKVAIDKDEWMTVWKLSKIESDIKLARRNVLRELKTLEERQAHFLKYKNHEAGDLFLQLVKKASKSFADYVWLFEQTKNPEQKKLYLKKLKKLAVSFDELNWVVGKMNSLNKSLFRRLRGQAKTLKQLLVTLNWHVEIHYRNQGLIKSIFNQAKALINNSTTALQVYQNVTHYAFSNYYYQLKESWHLVEKFTKTFSEWKAVYENDSVPRNRQVEALQYLRDTAKTFHDYLYLLNVVPESEKPLVLSKIKSFRKKEYLFIMLEKNLFNKSDRFDILCRLQASNKSNAAIQAYIVLNNNGELGKTAWKDLVAIVSKL